MNHPSLIPTSPLSLSFSLPINISKLNPLTPHHLHHYLASFTLLSSMASSFPSSSLTHSLSTLIILTTLLITPTNSLFLTLVNNCKYTVWPAIQPNAGHPVLASGGGFPLHPLTHQSIPFPDTHWSGRVWARTGCTGSGNLLTCATGDCGGRLSCNGAGGSAPATLAQFEVHHGTNDYSSYGVSLVDGFNVPFTITPHEGNGVCPVVGCRADLVATCPAPLQHRYPSGHGPVVACKSGCEAFHTDELCCRNHYNSPQTCKASVYSTFFKHACPSTFTFAHDTPSLMHQCSSPRELKIIFCH